jgi:signal peptidase
MKKVIILELILSIYIIIYEGYLSLLGETIVYIINPLTWLFLAVLCQVYISSKKRKEIYHGVDVLSIITILSLLYVIAYYLLGILAGYTNNPYSTGISGIIINFFSLLLVICLKEYIRYLFINVKIYNQKNIYYFSIFIVFLLSDISFLNIVNTQNILDLMSKELIIPVIYNLLMMYLAYVSDYKPAIISRTIITLPTLIFSVIPNYEWFIIMSFNIAYCLGTYIILQYVIGHKRRDLPLRLIPLLNPRKWITTLILILSTIAFGAGFLSFMPVVILTGSMEPLISPGDMIIIRRCYIEDITVGDIIEYKLEDYKIVHRVIAIYKFQGDIKLITKGDANKKADRLPVSSDQFIGKLEYTIPYVGYPSYLIKNIGNNNKQIDIEQGSDKK